MLLEHPVLIAIQSLAEPSELELVELSGVHHRVWPKIDVSRRSPKVVMQPGTHHELERLTLSWSKAGIQEVLAVWVEPAAECSNLTRRCGTRPRILIGCQSGSFFQKSSGIGMPQWIEQPVFQRGGLAERCQPLLQRPALHPICGIQKAASNDLAIAGLPRASFESAANMMDHGGPYRGWSLRLSYSGCQSQSYGKRLLKRARGVRGLGDRRRGLDRC